MTFLTTGQAPQGYQSVKPPRRIGGGTSASANEGADRLNNSQPPLLIHRYFQFSFIDSLHAIFGFVFIDEHDLVRHDNLNFSRRY